MCLCCFNIFFIYAFCDLQRKTLVLIQKRAPKSTTINEKQYCFKLYLLFPKKNIDNLRLSRKS